MRNLYLNAGMLLTALLLTIAGFSQSWPVQVQLNNGDRLKLYEPQPSAFSNNQLSFQAAVSLVKKGTGEPVFGTIWANSQTMKEGSYQVLQSISVTGLRFPPEIGESLNDEVEQALESAIPARQLKLADSDLNLALERNQQKESLTGSFQNKAPKVIYTNKPTLLVVVDGNPVWQRNDDWGMEALINSPNTIVRHSNGRLYLYGGKHWYQSSSLSGPFSYTAYPPASLSKVENAIREAEEKNLAADNKNEFENEFSDENLSPVENILVSTEPAELIQSRGEADFTPVSNTGLLYVENSPNDIFMDIASQQYFVLLSGRWYRSRSLNGNWEYISADDLPKDFSRIPAGSPKDNVLASVAGTPAATNALMDAQIPQTARVERSRATSSVEYDGEPEFERISGTKMSYAVNSSATVIRYRQQYFLVDNGVWFRSGSPYGPWSVSDVRPDEVDLIPPSYPVYNVKYVYIYDVTPDYIYMGYTPGYLNTYIYGPTVVYGTGYYYRPWHRRYYYPRPFTWGFNMHYSPWFGWSIGFNYYPGWFNTGYRYRPWDRWYGGWWGPTVYRPAYCGPSYRDYGYYGYRNNHFYVNERSYYGSSRHYYGNVYSQRQAISSRDNRRYYGSSYNNRNENNRPNARPDRRYYGSTNERPSVNDRPAINGRPNNERQRSIRPNQPNSNAPGRNYQNEARNNDRPTRSYRPSVNNNNERQQQERPASRQPNIQPQLRNRMENRERPAISRQPSPSSRQPQAQRQGPSRSPSGGGQGEVRRPERRGN
ncbi:hypothetical protein ACFSQD_03220 [Flavihumibacter stibioxidans]|uniref:Carbohydrate-binding family V/XII n=1 Tax=Flavihumibacter stibioxidans TaxID=1834163 RepID=A0ABR7MDQ1_9BACT|nr:hypothetical protein [Flavihumibacter stibioxidans]MBC6493160.1 hypothetical protein [Flavihumibacter stibioxidans]